MVAEGLEAFGAVGAGLSWVGRMAMTCYVLQNLIFSVIFYDFGLGLVGKLPAEWNTWGTLAVYVGVALFLVFGSGQGPRPARTTPPRAPSCPRGKQRRDLRIVRQRPIDHVTGGAAGFSGATRIPVRGAQGRRVAPAAPRTPPRTGARGSAAR